MHGCEVADARCSPQTCQGWSAWQSTEQITGCTSILTGVIVPPFRDTKCHSSVHRTFLSSVNLHSIFFLFYANLHVLKRPKNLLMFMWHPLDSTESFIKKRVSRSNCHCLHVHGPVSQHRLSLLGAVLYIFTNCFSQRRPRDGNLIPETRTSATVFMMMKQREEGDVQALHRTASRLSFWFSFYIVSQVLLRVDKWWHVGFQWK